MSSVKVGFATDADDSCAADPDGLRMIAQSQAVAMHRSQSLRMTLAPNAARTLPHTDS